MNFGTSMLFYGMGGIGKTLSILLTAKSPILIIPFEMRNYMININKAKRMRSDLEVDVKYFSIKDKPSIDKLHQFVGTPENFEKYNTILADTISSFMNISIRTIVEKESYEKTLEREKGRDEKNKTRKEDSVLDMARMDEYDYKYFTPHMNRVIVPIVEQLHHGKDVYFTAHEKINPSYAKRIEQKIKIGPNWTGKEFGENSIALFDFIGHVRPRYEKDSEVRKYPPKVYFNEEEALCKWTGEEWQNIEEKLKVDWLPLDVNVILYQSGLIGKDELNKRKQQLKKKEK